MAHSKQNKQKATSKDGKYRKETKEEKRLRLQAEEEARQQCFKMLPFVAGGVIIFLIIFGLYVRSVPPKKATTFDLKPNFEDGVPEFLTVKTDPVGEPMEQPPEGWGKGEGGDAVRDEPPAENTETIEL